jgi:RNA polymerase sigma-70 factor (ECF subfamily)
LKERDIEMADVGDATAFDAFYRNSSRRLYGQAYVLTGSREIAEDLTHEAFLRAWKHWQRIGDYEGPEAWTRRVLHNLCIDSWRKSRPRVHNVLDPVPASVEIPTHHLQLAEAMRSLPGQQARALLLHDGLGMTIAETAGDLGVPEGTVTSWLTRSRKIVAAKLEQPDPFMGGE